MSTSPSDAALTVRRAYHQARSGDLQGAARLCTDVLLTDAWNPEAWLLRAVIAMRSGTPEEALTAARRALPLHSTPAPIHALIGDALYELQRPAEAAESYAAALAIDPGSASALFGRARALLALRRHREAVAGFDELLRRQPDDFEALMMRGRAQFELREPAAALASYERAAALQPANADAACNRGAVLLLLQRPDEALRNLDIALSLAPDLSEAHRYRAEALRRLGEPAEALRSLDRALEVRKDDVAALISRGVVLCELRRPQEALESFGKARALDGASAAAQRGIGDALLDMGRPEAAFEAHEAALRLGSERPQTLVSLANSLRALGRHGEAAVAYDESLLANPGMPLVPGALLYTQLCRGDWETRVAAATPAQIVHAVRCGSPACAPFAFLSVSDDAALQLECARAFSRHELGWRRPERPRPRYRHARVRLAYVSADLRAHAVSYLLAGVLERHDRGRFELTAIALQPPEDSATGARVRAAFERFVDASAMGDREIVNLMRGLEIDIAVDLTGYTQGHRPHLLAAGVAPIQVSYLGYPGTLGSSCVDYLIADEFVIPAERRAQYAESIAYLPDCFQANDDRRAQSARRFTRPELGLPQDALLLCCLNSTHKINAAMFDVWMRVLARAPRAVLWLQSQAPDVPGNLRREAASRGIDPARIVFTERLAYPDYLASLELADLFLDTLPFNGGATASDALWAGVPLLTCAGDAYAARMAGSLLHAAGLPEGVTASLADYESRAVELATTPALLAAWRARLAAGRHAAPLFDTARFTTHLEAAYLEMWNRHERGEAPSTFAVGPGAAPSTPGV